MQRELVKIRPIPNHFHKAGQVVCERCMSQIASSGNSIIDALHEYSYVTAQLTRICLEGALCFLISLSQIIATGILRMVPNIREFCFQANEVLLIVAQFVLVAALGIGAVISAMFPGVTGRKSAYDEELDNRYKAKKQKEWEQLQKDKRDAQAYDEERDAQFRAHHEKLRALKGARAEWSESRYKSWIKEQEEAYARDDADLEEYEKNRQSINGPELNAPKIFMGTELAEDDYLVKSINNTIKGIENGTDDPEKLRKMSEELIKQRQDTANKDARRRELMNKCKDKDWEASRLFADADRAFKKGDRDEGERLLSRAYSAQSDANGLHNQFLAV